MRKKYEMYEQILNAKVFCPGWSQTRSLALQTGVLTNTKTGQILVIAIPQTSSSTKFHARNKLFIIIVLKRLSARSRGI